MAYEIGVDCKVFRNTSVWGTPAWDELTNIEVVQQGLEAAEAEFRNRGIGFVQSAPGLIKGTIELTLTWTPGTNADYEALRDAFTGKNTIDLWFLDGASATSDNQGLRADFAVLSMSRAEPLEEGVTVTFTLAPGVSVNAASWASVA